MAISPRAGAPGDGHGSLPATETPGPVPSAQSALTRLPVRFEPNVGQASDGIAYVAKARDYQVSATPGAIYFGLAAPKAEESRSGPDRQEAGSQREAMQRSVVSMSFVGANASSEIIADEPQSGISNYFLGSDPARWRTDVPGYSKIRYEDLWPGISLVLHDESGEIEYEFVVAPGADPAQIALEFDGHDGLGISESGELAVSTSTGNLTHSPPVAFQGESKAKGDVAAKFVVRTERVMAFEVGAYDPARSLAIDPTLAYSSYLGGTGSDAGHGIAVDSSGAAYVAGLTGSTNFPTAGTPFQSAYAGNYDAFVTKVASSGSSLIYSSYFGGSNADRGYGIAVDSAGAAYIAGHTQSTNFPTAGTPFQGTNAGNYDAFITKVAPSGSSLIYSSYLGGSNLEYGRQIAVDSAGAAYIAGHTQSTNFPTVGTPFQGAYAGGGDAFVTKVAPSGSTLAYSSFLGGWSWDIGFGIAVDSAGAAYVTGETWSTNFPTAGTPFQSAYAGWYDAFVTKVAPSGSTLSYSSYLGGSSSDRGNGIAVDSSGAAYVAGNTYSTNFPTAGAPFQGTNAGSWDVFVTKFVPSGSTLAYSSYLGGSGNEYGYGIAVDSSGAAYVTGETWFADFPIAGTPVQGTYAGGYDAFVTKFAPSGSTLAYSSFLGGSRWDIGYGIAVDSSGATYVTGETASTNFPTAGTPFQGTNAGSWDVFVTKFAASASTAFLAEGSTEGGFETWILVTNPSLTKPAQARLTFFTFTGSVPGPTITVPPGSRVTVNANSYVTSWDVSTKVEGLDYPVVAERAVYSANPGHEGAHLGKAMEQSANSWFLPEGSTGPGFETWILVANFDSTITAQVNVTFLTGAGPVVGPSFALPPQSRRSVRANDTVTTYDLSTRVTSTGTGVVVERSSYISTRSYHGATASPASPGAANSWNLGEGSTGPGFETWILVANPDPGNSANVAITYLTSAGAHPGPSFSLAPQSRRSIRANDTVVAWDVSTNVTSTGTGVVVERAMYSTPASPFGLTAASGEGVEQPANSWFLPEGSTGPGFETWILVANPDPAITANVEITYLTGGGPVAGPNFALAPGSRRSVRVNDTVTTYDVSTKVTSTGTGVVADHTIYSVSGAPHDATTGPGVALA